MTLLCVNQSKIRMPRAFLEKWVRACRRELRRELAKSKAAALDGELVVAFLDEKPARALNKQHRGRDYATDVLSFESDSFGELVLCPQVIQRQAREHGLSFQEELGYLVLHGILHLLGYDHERSAREEKIMLNLQDRVFEKLRSKKL